MGETILTTELTAEDKAEKRKRQQDLDIVELGCQIWYESLKDQSISRQRAIDNITNIIMFNINEGRIYENVGAKLLGTYIIKCRRERDVCNRKRAPSGWVGLVRELSNKLPYPKVENSKNIETVYESMSRRLNDCYGMDFTVPTLKRWDNKK